MWIRDGLHPRRGGNRHPPKPRPWKSEAQPGSMSLLIEVEDFGGVLRPIRRIELCGCFSAVAALPPWKCDTVLISF